MQQTNISYLHLLMEHKETCGIASVVVLAGRPSQKREKIGVKFQLVLYFEPIFTNVAQKWIVKPIHNRAIKVQVINKSIFLDAIQIPMLWSVFPRSPFGKHSFTLLFYVLFCCAVEGG